MNGYDAKKAGIAQNLQAFGQTLTLKSVKMSGSDKGRGGNGAGATDNCNLPDSTHKGIRGAVQGLSAGIGAIGFLCLCQGSVQIGIMIARDHADPGAGSKSFHPICCIFNLFWQGQVNQVTGNHIYIGFLGRQVIGKICHHIRAHVMVAFKLPVYVSGDAFVDQVVQAHLG